MASTARSNIDYRLLDRLSNLVICSRCLRNGIVTPVPQVISDRHSLTLECRRCRQENAANDDSSVTPGKLPPLAQ